MDNKQKRKEYYNKASEQKKIILDLKDEAIAIADTIKTLNASPEVQKELDELSDDIIVTLYKFYKISSFYVYPAKRILRACYKAYEKLKSDGIATLSGLSDLWIKLTVLIIRTQEQEEDFRKHHGFIKRLCFPADFMVTYAIILIPIIQGLLQTPMMFNTSFSRVAIDPHIGYFIEYESIAPENAEIVGFRALDTEDEDITNATIVIISFANLTGKTIEECRNESGTISVALNKGDLIYNAIPEPFVRDAQTEAIRFSSDDAMRNRFSVDLSNLAEGDVFKVAFIYSGDKRDDSDFSINSVRENGITYTLKKMERSPGYEPVPMIYKISTVLATLLLCYLCSTKAKSIWITYKIGTCLSGDVRVSRFDVAIAFFSAISIVAMFFFSQRFF